MISARAIPGKALDTPVAVGYRSSTVKDGNVSGVRYCGRLFHDEEIEWIRQLIATEESLGRTALSQRICDELGWLAPGGRRKEMSCRVALLRMERDGLISLPPRQSQNGMGRIRPVPITSASDPGRPISDPVGLLPGLVFEVVESGRDSRLYNELIDRYHYLGYKPLAGAQIRYQVRAGSDLVAVLGFGAAAWALAARDRYIGWSPHTRKRNLHLVVCNARFLILPWVKSKNLASCILGRVARRLPADWEARYGYPPVLLETCVQKDRFRGTCYRAANWIPVGETKGRGKCCTTHRRVLPVKGILVYPLRAGWKRRLCSAAEASSGA